MTKFKVHIFEEVRRAYVVEAKSMDEAREKVVQGFYNMDPVESEETGELVDCVLVDTLLDNGETDYAHSKWTALCGDSL